MLGPQCKKSRRPLKIKRVWSPRSSCGCLNIFPRSISGALAGLQWRRARGRCLRRTGGAVGKSTRRPQTQKFRQPRHAGFEPGIVGGRLRHADFLIISDSISPGQLSHGAMPGAHLTRCSCLRDHCSGCATVKNPDSTGPVDQHTSPASSWITGSSPNHRAKSNRLAGC